MKHGLIFFLLPALLFLHFCAPRTGANTAPLPVKNDLRQETSTADSPASPGEDREIVPMQAEKRTGGIFQTGTASWYGKKFHGRRTANGEIYDMYKLTAAHKELPFNTFVEVENLLDGKKILVRINDRGPFVKGRIIDLSYRAAQKAGFAERGTAPVRLRIVKPGEKTSGITAKKESPSSGDEPGSPVTHIKKSTPSAGYEAGGEGECYIQAGAFSSQANARRLVRRIREILPGVTFEVFFRDGLYKIISEDFSTRAKAEGYKETLERNGITVFIKGRR